MFQAPGTTAMKCLEVVTPDWKYYDNDDFNFEDSHVVPVKEQRRMGTQRGNKTTPQAPAIEVRARGLPDGPIACRCRLWNFGPCSDRERPRHDGSATELTMLRANVIIEVTENVAMFGPMQEDGFRYAKLRCFITRGARVQCKKFHIAFYVDCVQLPPDLPTPGPDDSNFPIIGPLDYFPWARTARMSISEKAMCPRMHDKTKKAKSKAMKALASGSIGDMDSGSSDEDQQSPGESSPKRLKRGIDNMSASKINSSVVATPITKRLSPINTGRGGKRDIPGSAPIPNMQPQGGMLMPPHMPGLGAPPNAGGMYNGGGGGGGGLLADRSSRISRFSFPGLEDDMLHHSGMSDEGDLAHMESALGHARRSSQFINNQYHWFPGGPYYSMNQPGVLGHQSMGNGGMGMGGNLPPLPGGTSPLPVANQSPTFGNTLQPSLSIDFTNELSNQRRLSTSGNWSAELHSRRISAADLSRISNSPLPPSQPGRGPEWDALFDAHAKVVLLDKTSHDYLTKKTSLMAEVYRAAELIEQRFQKRV